MLAIMAVSVTVLASGSKGNCTLVSSSATRLLIDAGLSCRELLRRLMLCGQDARSIDAVLITHEHSDHVAGLRVLARRLKIPVYITAARNTSVVRATPPAIASISIAARRSPPALASKWVTSR
jgi:phosphoribosyl 1,2-cyclic phosphodiesterase